MIMLSSLVPEEIAHAIQVEDVRTIQSIKGIGAKTAQRVIVDLKDKMLKMNFSTENIFVQNNTNRFDALTALISLGFDKKAAEKAIDKVAQGDDSVEKLIKEALKIL
jgi:Holliday junction DNA helicase RuvA